MTLSEGDIVRLRDWREDHGDRGIVRSTKIMAGVLWIKVQWRGHLGLVWELAQDLVFVRPKYPFNEESKT